MLMPASAEFSALCRAQISVVARAIGAEATAVYLAESWNEQALPKLVPVAVYPAVSATEPEAAAAVGRGQVLTGKRKSADSREPPQATQVFALPPVQGHPNLEVDPRLPDNISPSVVNPLLPAGEHAALNVTSAQQLAIPLVHEGGMMGLLVSWRADRPWQSMERHRMEECAHSLALACVMDQRGQWLQQQLSTLKQLQTQQSDRFHELLHQLRNPLTAVKTFGKLLFKRLEPEDRSQTLVNSLLRESDRMQHILGYFDDTLQAADQSRADTMQTVPLLSPSAREHQGNVDPTGANHNGSATTLETQALSVSAEPLVHFGGSLDIATHAVATLIAPLVTSTRTLAEASCRSFHVFYPAQAVLLRVDATALTEIISNFLENALKYSPPGSHVWLAWGLMHPEDADLVGTLVGDTGPGIPVGDQPHIFERQYRGIQQSGTLPGSGLGLAIANDLAHEMGGVIEVYSPLAEYPWLIPDRFSGDSLDAGTAFVVWLPIAE